MVSDSSNNVILVDLDGTLLDVMERHYRVYKEIVRRLVGNHLDKDKYLYLKTNNKSWEYILKKSSIEVNDKAVFLNEFIRKIEQKKYLKLDSLQKDAVKSIKKLRNNHEMYLITRRKSKENTMRQISALKLKEYFNNIFIEKTNYYFKMKFINKRGLIIGDTEYEIQLAKYIRFKSIILSNGLRSKRYLKKQKPNKLINNLNEACKYIDTLNDY